MSPVVGITQSLDDRGRWRSGREYLYLDAAYSRAVTDAGGVPFHLPIQADIVTLLDCIDALLIPGGDDFVPVAAYPDSVDFDPVPARQLDFDRRLLEGALERSLPVLGICYGMQLLALLHGGSLHHHLPFDRPDAQAHSLPEDSGRHPIEVVPGTRLAQLLGPAPQPVNSLHHQAVATTGPGLRVCARSSDSVIEGVEREGSHFCLGVQWHPEKLDGASRETLFRALVAAC